ncbi:PREDICTED: protein lin-54 homolog isoform X3 [Drosophila arizonae]|uniref:Protein lin-54 homolog isoform X3 n=1 Tax=Drosophila arizonae TaxID=7263 RepID=A0ABM1PES0_DROAR|nr:PREDICTED: protein lin-54 homolog isoform X3 [Drosophila arizonae]
MDTNVSSELDELDDTTTLPGFTFYDLLEPSMASKQQNLDSDDNGGGCDTNLGMKRVYMEKKEPSATTNELLNTSGQKKAPIVRILENKRLTAPMGAALKNMLGENVRVVTTPTKTASTTEIKILNKLQAKPLNAFGNAPVKIGSTTIAAPTTSPKNIGVKMTPIKTADGKVIYLQKSLPVTGGTTSKVPLASGISDRLASTGSNIRHAILSKGVTLSGTCTIKSNSPSLSSSTARGLTAAETAKPAAHPSTNVVTPSASSGLIKGPSSADAVSTPVATKIQVVRTADGKLIKLNQGSPSVLLNTKPAIPTTVSGNNSNKVMSKPTAQVIIKGPLKQLPAGSSLRPIINNSGSSNNATSSSSSAVASTAITTSASPSIPGGKMLVQSSTGKQIVVANKDIIKLWPMPNTSTTTTTANPNTASSGLHAIQLPGKSGLQYVRVLPNNSNNSSASNETTTSPQKVSLGRPRTTSNNTSSTISVGNTTKIVMKTTGGSIVPLPSMQTLVPRRAPGTTPNTAYTKPLGNNSSLDGAHKHRVSDVNVQIKHLSSDSASDAGAPEAKKARYVIAMPHTSTTSASGTAPATAPASQKNMQKIMGTRATQMQRFTVQGANMTGSNNPPTRKIYNLVTKSDANGVKYMICNKGGEGKPRTVFNTTMRRGYTLADSKLRRPLAAQQARLKQMKQHQHRLMLPAQAKQRQQLQQIQKHQTTITKPQQQQTLKSTATQETKIAIPSKPLFDILKPPPVPAPAAGAAAALDALGGTRRKHCNCSKSQCLKLYCDCFANGEFCQDCTCKDCFNNLDYEVKREEAIRSCLERNPSAFKPKITAPNSGDIRLHNKGCNCKRSGCLKNYCECYEAKIPCSTMCKCVGCRNMEDRPDVDMDSMDSLVDTKLQTNKVKDLNGTYLQENRSNVYLTDDVIEATIMCMISRIVMHEKQNLPVEDTEREVMEELGESLNQIITFAKEKNDTFHTDDPKTTAA